MKLKSSCTAKETIYMKSQSTKCDEIFVNHMSDKGLIFKKDKELVQLDSKKKKSDLNMGRGLE